MSETNGFSMAFGALAPSLKTQLVNMGIRLKQAEVSHFQADADAIARLSVRLILQPASVDKARRILLRRIGECVVGARAEAARG